jgi:hypothetical protein
MVDPLEHVALELNHTPGFFQLYTPTDRGLAESLVHRAEQAGFKAIVLTLDTWLTGWRPRDLSTSNFPQLRGQCLANYFVDPHFRATLTKTPEEDLCGATWQSTVTRVWPACAQARCRRSAIAVRWLRLSPENERQRSADGGRQGGEVVLALEGMEKDTVAGSPLDGL